MMQDALYEALPEIKCKTHLELIWLRWHGTQKWYILREC